VIPPSFAALRAPPWRKIYDLVCSQGAFKLKGQGAIEDVGRCILQQLGFADFVVERILIPRFEISVFTDACSTLLDTE
jgi:hypothetical protein